MMDPDCAICSQPAVTQCDCEAKGLEVAVRQAEQRMMDTHFGAIRAWVRGHAQDYILAYYEVLTTRRKEAHVAHINSLTSHYARMYHTHPHPAEVARAQNQLKQGIDADWRASVQRYPEVLEYFYSLVEMSLPREDEPAVRDPPLSALSGARKYRPRERERERATIEEKRARSRDTPASSRRPGRSVPWASPAPGSGYAYVRYD